MGRLFGTDGIRGRANIYPMSPDFVLKLGQTIGIYFRKNHKHPRILVGKDTRRSCYMLEQALCSGICSVGVDAFLLGPLPTPGIAYLTRGLRASAGIVISASHNPYMDNGIKIFSSNGFKLPDEVEDELEEMLLRERLGFELPTGNAVGIAKRIDDAVGQYAVFLKEQFPKNLTLDGLKIVLDTANGAAYKVAPKVLWELGAEIITCGDKPNGTNINENCGALHPDQVKSLVLEHKADLGIALDGDGDRVVLVDEKGEVVDGDEILALCATHMLKTGKLKNNTVVSTIMSNFGLEAAIHNAGGQLHRTKVGDRYVVDAMQQFGYVLGGEQSGHLVFLDSSTTGDGILAAMKVLEIMLVQKRPLSELKKIMKKFPQVIRNIPVEDKVPLEQMPTFNAMIADLNQSMDGIGRVLVRYSGTETLARVMVEGQDPSKTQQIADQVAGDLSTAIANYRRDVAL